MPDHPRNIRTQVLEKDHGQSSHYSTFWQAIQAGTSEHEVEKTPLRRVRRNVSSDSLNSSKSQEPFSLENKGKQKAKPRDQVPALFFTKEYESGDSEEESARVRRGPSKRGSRYTSRAGSTYYSSRVPKTLGSAASSFVAPSLDNVDAYRKQEAREGRERNLKDFERKRINRNSTYDTNPNRYYQEMGQDGPSELKAWQDNVQVIFGSYFVQHSFSEISCSLQEDLKKIKGSEKVMIEQIDALLNEEKWKKIRKFIQSLHKVSHKYSSSLKAAKHLEAIGITNREALFKVILATLKSGEADLQAHATLLFKESSINHPELKNLTLRILSEVQSSAAQYSKESIKDIYNQLTENIYISLGKYLDKINFTNFYTGQHIWDSLEQYRLRNPGEEKTPSDECFKNALNSLDHVLTVMDRFKRKHVFFQKTEFYKVIYKPLFEIEGIIAPDEELELNVDLSHRSRPATGESNDSAPRTSQDDGSVFDEGDNATLSSAPTSPPRNFNQSRPHTTTLVKAESDTSIVKPSRRKSSNRRNSDVPTSQTNNPRTRVTAFLQGIGENVGLAKHVSETTRDPRQKNGQLDTRRTRSTARHSRRYHDIEKSRTEIQGLLWEIRLAFKKKLWEGEARRKWHHMRRLLDRLLHDVSNGTLGRRLLWKLENILRQHLERLQQDENVDFTVKSIQEINRAICDYVRECAPSYDLKIEDRVPRKDSSIAHVKKRPASNRDRVRSEEDSLSVLTAQSNILQSHQTNSTCTAELTLTIKPPLWARLLSVKKSFEEKYPLESHDSLQGVLKLVEKIDPVQAKRIESLIRNGKNPVEDLLQLLDGIITPEGVKQIHTMLNTVEKETRTRALPKQIQGNRFTTGSPK